MASKKVDNVNHPPHYTSHPSGIECIVITRHMGFNLGNVMKYIWRDGLKEDEVPLEALKKARWYLDDEINRRKQALISDVLDAQTLTEEEFRQTLGSEEEFRQKLGKP